MNDGYNIVSEPVMGIYALYGKPDVEAPVLGTVDPSKDDEDEDAKAAKAAVQAKVITNPGKEKAAAKAAAASTAVETK